MFAIVNLQGLLLNIKMNEKQTTNKKNKEKYLIYCPKCKSTFNVSEQMNIWRDEFLEKINKIIEEDLK